MGLGGGAQRCCVGVVEIVKVCELCLVHGGHAPGSPSIAAIARALQQERARWNVRGQVCERERA